MNKTLFCAALAGLGGVALGAFGAHALKDELAARGTTDVWHTAVLYQLVHAVAALAVGLFSSVRADSAGENTRANRGGHAWLTRAGVAWLAGVALFSGSLYVLALGGPKWLGPVTPLGGILLLLGWGCVLVAACGRKSVR